MGFTLRLEYVEDDWDTVLVVFSNNALICVCSVWFDHSTFLLRCFRRFMVFEEQSFRIQNWWIFAKEECLYLNKLDIVVLRLLGRKLWLSSCSRFILIIRFLAALSWCRLHTFLCWTVRVGRSWRFLSHNGWRWVASSWLTSWRQC